MGLGVGIEVVSAVAVGRIIDRRIVVPSSHAEVSYFQCDNYAYLFGGVIQSLGIKS